MQLPSQRRAGPSLVDPVSFDLTCSMFCYRLYTYSVFVSLIYVVFRTTHHFIVLLLIHMHTHTHTQLLVDSRLAVSLQTRSSS